MKLSTISLTLIRKIDWGAILWRFKYRLLCSLKNFNSVILCDFYKVSKVAFWQELEQTKQSSQIAVLQYEIITFIIQQ